MQHEYCNPCNNGGRQRSIKSAKALAFTLSPRFLYFSTVYPCLGARMVATRQSAYATINDWGLLTGMSRAATYDAISRGHLHTRKLGARTLIDCQAGLAWLDA